MKEQNFKNHARLVAGFHGVAFLAIVILLIGAIRNFIRSSEENLYSASLLILISIIFLLLFYFVRAFALKAQDRAIRAEEKLRYFILTGKALSSKITTRQIIGLRFASDTEIVALVDRAEKENLSEKEIKKLIKNWKADTYRV
jgi:cbb3-type cytochrome oxidase subunit 3